jgi:hypothetical protein
MQTANPYKELIVKKIALITAIAATFTSGLVLAETRAEIDTQRNVNQQKRIEQGLQSGELTTREAGQLERQQEHVDKVETRAMRDGSIGVGEQAHIDATQDRASHAIAHQKHDAQIGHRNSASPQRMQADVQRNVNQQQRIHNGLESGELTNHEAARLERGQSHVERHEANAAADGHVSRVNQNRIQRGENHQSQHIHKQKHD